MGVRDNIQSISESETHELALGTITAKRLSMFTLIDEQHNKMPRTYKKYKKYKKHKNEKSPKTIKQFLIRILSYFLQIVIKKPTILRYHVASK